ncbi:hypothetical protein AFLA70_266g001871 [Aspergillus flavus AF70]|nr:hypothetical protein AFLA70_266g001871 [Aspergillus flavus AF70]
MQSLFRSVKYIRRMIDIIPPSSDLEPPMMVLEPVEKTLWSARTKRPLTLREVKHIMKFALLGLQEIHEKGLVHCVMAPGRAKLPNHLLKSGGFLWQALGRRC